MGGFVTQFWFDMKKDSYNYNLKIQLHLNLWLVYD